MFMNRDYITKVQGKKNFLKLKATSKDLADDFTVVAFLKSWPNLWLFLCYFNPALGNVQSLFILQENKLQKPSFCIQNYELSSQEKALKEKKNDAYAYMIIFIPICAIK